MFVLAIDTALDACAAAVLDTQANKLIASESLPMKRGHAEALMPLVAPRRFIMSVRNPWLESPATIGAGRAPLKCGRRQPSPSTD